MVEQTAILERIGFYRPRAVGYQNALERRTPGEHTIIYGAQTAGAKGAELVEHSNFCSFEEASQFFRIGACSIYIVEICIAIKVGRETIGRKYYVFHFLVYRLEETRTELILVFHPGSVGKESIFLIKTELDAEFRGVIKYTITKRKLLGLHALYMIVAVGYLIDKVEILKLMAMSKCGVLQTDIERGIINIGHISMSIGHIKSLQVVVALEGVVFHIIKLVVVPLSKVVDERRKTFVFLEFLFVGRIDTHVIYIVGARGSAERKSVLVVGQSIVATPLGMLLDNAYVFCDKHVFIFRPIFIIEELLEFFFADFNPYIRTSHAVHAGENIAHGNKVVGSKSFVAVILALGTSTAQHKVENLEIRTTAEH